MIIDNIEPGTPITPPEPRRNRFPLFAAIGVAVFVAFSPLTAMTFMPVLTLIGIYGFAWLYLSVWRGERIWTPTEYLREHGLAFVHPNIMVRGIFIGCVALSVLGSMMLLFSGVVASGWFAVIGVVVSGVQIVWAGYSLAALRDADTRAEQEAIIAGFRVLLRDCHVPTDTVEWLDITVEDGGLAMTIKNPPREMLNSVLARRVDKRLQNFGSAVEKWDKGGIRVVALVPETPGEGLEIPDENAARAPQFAAATSTPAPSTVPTGAPPVALDLSGGW